MEQRQTKRVSLSSSACSYGLVCLSSNRVCFSCSLAEREALLAVRRCRGNNGTLSRLGSPAEIVQTVFAVCSIRSAFEWKRKNTRQRIQTLATRPRAKDTVQTSRPFLLDDGTLRAKVFFCYRIAIGKERKNFLFSQIRLRSFLDVGY